MQKYVNLVDLEKCCKMSIWLQRLASMTPITSPLYFDILDGSEIHSQNPILVYRGPYFQPSAVTGAGPNAFHSMREESEKSEGIF